MRGRRPLLRFWRWGTPERARPRAARRRPPIFEALEPRLLLSSSPLGLVLDVDPLEVNTGALVEPLEPTGTERDAGVAPAATITQTPQPGGQVLLTVTGTGGADAILVKTGRAPGQVEVTLNGGPRAVIDHVSEILIVGGAGDDRIDLAPRLAIGAEIHGGDGHDLIRGGGGGDRLFGEDGNDVIDGRGGDDELDGGPGADHIRGGAGADSIRGGAGRDVIAGGDGDDAIAGGDGADLVKGQAGADVIAGGAGPDVLEGGPGDDTLDGGADGDTIKGQAGVDLALNGETLSGVEVTMEAQPPVITAALLHDTGASEADGLTSDPTIGGRVTDASPVLVFRAGLDDTPPGGFSDVLNLLDADGRFTFDRARLEAIAGAPLADDAHVLHLQAQDAFGNLSGISDVAFLLDTQTPPTPVFDLADESDSAPPDDQQTTAATVRLEGTTEALAAMELLGLALAVTADEDGHFALDDIPLELGPNELTVRATDGAGNASEFERTLTRVAEEEEEDTEAPVVAAALASDTGASATDGITSDPAIAGRVTDGSALAAGLAGLDDQPRDDIAEALGDVAGA